MFLSQRLHRILKGLFPDRGARAAQRWVGRRIRSCDYQRLKSASIAAFMTLDVSMLNRRRRYSSGPNEAGKTALLEALQQLNAPKGVRGFDPLRDYPRSEYNDITTGKVIPEKVTVVEGRFALEPDDQREIPEEFRNCTYVFGRKLDNSACHRLDGRSTNSNLCFPD